MATTIQVQKATVGLLTTLKGSYNAKSYDEVINILANRKTGKSMFGKLANGRKYSMKEILEGLRDERDRI